LDLWWTDIFCPDVLPTSVTQDFHMGFSDRKSDRGR